ncbi:CoxG family protein [Virgibacillus necropolis]|uniref:Carbon monoxide dehydrogenase n=1 Tax=Virgibacillus necropolis TaxID=163877 RepID=A0A221MAE2_9BACI|nr:SRPBCC family protein [Virgibacillus necropolis]ASN04582.1 carbon monoxide dehydrogenase [Virgibacillus necropolis]
MPNGIYQLELDIPIKNVWSFVSDMNNWAPLVPGYMEHKILNDRQSTWKFKGEVGIIQKTVSLKIDITEWQEPSLVTFDLTGLNENFKGDGYFKAEAINGRKTKITGYIAITAKGMMGPMVNSFLKSFVPKTTKDLTEAVAAKIIELESVTT